MLEYYCLTRHTARGTPAVILTTAKVVALVLLVQGSPTAQLRHMNMEPSVDVVMFEEISVNAYSGIKWSTVSADPEVLTPSTRLYVTMGVLPWLKVLRT
jgi:hypothetical protein